MLHWKKKAAGAAKKKEAKQMNQNRLRQVIANMKGQGLEQIVVSATASVYYLTGIWVSPMERMLALYITTEGQCTLYANELFGIEPQPGMELVLHSDSDEPTAQLARQLRRHGVECEYADRDFLVVMATPENTPEDLARAAAALGTCPGQPKPLQLPLARGEQACSIRQAAFSFRETVAAADSLGRICGLPTVGCPPAIPIAVSGERIAPEALALFEYYGISQVEVLVE